MTVEAEGGPVDCGVIVVTYNSAADIGRLLESLPAAAGSLALRVVVVDNGSTDATVETVQGVAGVVCVATGANLGYAGAINVGRAWVGPCSSLLVANPDLWFEPGSIALLHDALSRPGVGVVVPTLLDGAGRRFPSIRREPSVTRAFGDALWGNRFARRPGWLAETVLDPDEYTSRHEVAWATGAALLVDQTCDAAVGAWDDSRFFLYSEETDFARRAREAGFRIDYVPAARVHHRGGGSGRSSALVALMAVNRVRYFEKWHRRPSTSLFRAAAVLNELLRSFDRGHRSALFHLLRRSSWADLPSSAADQAPRA